MNDENTTGDAELDAIVFGEDIPSKETPQANPSEKQVLEAGGRKWDDAGKLAKSYDALVRDYSKTKNELKGLKPWGEFGKFLDGNPQLKDELKKRIDEYNQLKASGSTQKEAQKEAGIPKEVAEKIERLESQHADLMLDREISALQTKYKLPQDELNAVLKFSSENDGIDLEKAYKLMSYDKRMLEATENGKKGAVASAQRKTAANVGPSNHSSVAPAGSSGRKLTNEEHASKLSKRLDELGFKD